MTPTRQQVQPRHQYPTVVLLVLMPTLPLPMEHKHERGKISSGCIEKGFHCIFKGRIGLPKSYKEAGVQKRCNSDETAISAESLAATV
jgi:hypothetical protein